MRLKPKHVNWIRLAVLAVIFIVAMWGHYQHTVVGQAAPSVHALCPYGGLETLQAYLASGSLLQRIFSGTLTLFFVTIALALLFNRSFCGILCPFGALQEWLGLILKRKLTVPPSVDRVLRYAKYGVLALTTFMAWRTATLWMAPYDPWAALAHIFNPAEALAAPVGLALLSVTVVGSVLYDRFFCKYLCPAGAMYALVARISPYRLRWNQDACIDCKRCDKACPMNLSVSNGGADRAAECIACGKCVNACPKPAALQLKFASIPVRPLLAIALVVVVFFGSLYALDAAGLYRVSAVPTAGETIQVAELKGWMTITQGAEYTGVPLDRFYEAMGIPREVPETTAFRDIGSLVPGWTFGAMKGGEGH